MLEFKNLLRSRLESKRIIQGRLPFGSQCQGLWMGNVRRSPRARKPSGNARDDPKRNLEGCQCQGPTGPWATTKPVRSHVPSQHCGRFETILMAVGCVLTAARVNDLLKRILHREALRKNSKKLTPRENKYFPIAVKDLWASV
ncbi:hypothetical protein M0804_001257 [Polistes exclamans]|nr:hypothetical protein M0804_001257 [Polistes exclamans]